MIKGRVIRGVDCTGAGFQKALSQIKDRNAQEEIKAALRDLLLTGLDAPPRYLHLHQLKQKKVPSMTRHDVKCNPWSIHVTRNDVYKASFTLEGSIALMRNCAEHDVLDRKP